MTDQLANTSGMKVYRLPVLDQILVGEEKLMVLMNNFHVKGESLTITSGI